MYIYIYIYVCVCVIINLLFIYYRMSIGKTIEKQKEKKIQKGSKMLDILLNWLVIMLFTISITSCLL